MRESVVCKTLFHYFPSFDIFYSFRVYDFDSSCIKKIDYNKILQNCDSYHSFLNSLPYNFDCMFELNPFPVKTVKNTITIFLIRITNSQ